MKYTIDKRFKSHVERTERVLEVGQAFGLGLSDKEFVIYNNLELDVNQGDVVYIYGQSGSGKSLLLSELVSQMRAANLVVSQIEDAVEDNDKPLIDQIGVNMTDALRLLSLAGLNDAYLFVRKPSELSDGQKYRFRLTKMIESDADVWVADEFGAVLDRTTAKVIAFNAQKLARQHGKTLIVATTHADLIEDLNPNLYVEKHYRDKVRVDAKSGDATKEHY